MKEVVIQVLFEGLIWDLREIKEEKGEAMQKQNLSTLVGCDEVWKLKS